MAAPASFSSWIGKTNLQRSRCPLQQPIQPRRVQPNTFMVRRQTHDSGTEATGGTANSKGECPWARGHEFRSTTRKRIADELLNSAATLWRVNSDGRLLLPRRKRSPPNK